MVVVIQAVEIIITAHGSVSTGTTCRGAAGRQVIL
jgi:hypothetical protein